MIRFAKQKDKEELLALCVNAQPMKEHAFLEYYFSHLFKEGKALLSEVDNKLISQLHTQEHVLCLQDKKIMVSYILGVATHYDYRKRGIMRDLMSMTLEDCSKNHLLTFIEAGNPRLFEKYGFETIAFRKRYVVYAKEMLPYTKTGVSNQCNAQELVRVYKQFYKLFDCYYDRDEEYYRHFIAMAQDSGAHLCVHRDTQGVVDGYALYYEKEDGVEIKEVIYMNANILLKMMKYAMGYTPYLSVEVSKGERLEKIFKLSIPRESTGVMVRINDFKLFNKLFNTQLRHTKDIHTILHKPVLINEKY